MWPILILTSRTRKPRIPLSQILRFLRPSRTSSEDSRITLQTSIWARASAIPMPWAKYRTEHPCDRVLYLHIGVNSSIFAPYPWDCGYCIFDTCYFLVYFYFFFSLASSKFSADFRSLLYQWAPLLFYYASVFADAHLDFLSFCWPMTMYVCMYICCVQVSWMLTRSWNTDIWYLVTSSKDTNPARLLGVGRSVSPLFEL